MQLGKFLLYHRFKLALALVLLSNVILAVIILSVYLQKYLWFDLWYFFTYGIARKFCDPSYVVFSGLPGYGGLYTYWHSITPLYPFLSASLTLIIGNIPAASIIVATACSLLSLVFLGKILQEFCQFNQDRTYMMLSIYASFYTTAELFCIPSPISIVPFFAIMDMYFVLKYFKSPSPRNLFYLSFAFAATLFSREIMWPIFALPFIVLLLLFIFEKRGTIRGVRALKFPSILSLVIAMIIPLIIYACYFVGLNLFHALGILIYNLQIMNDRSIGTVLYNLFTTITFYWVLVAIAFISVLYSSIQRSLKKRAQLPESHSNPATYPASLQAGDVGQVESKFDSFFNEKLVYAIFASWFLFYILYRIILPGPFWELYYFPVLYLASFIVFRGMQAISKHHIEMVFWIVIIIIVLLNLANLFELDPFSWSI
jgi:hypothetical protein